MKFSKNNLKKGVTFLHFLEYIHERQFDLKENKT